MKTTTTKSLFAAALAACCVAHGAMRPTPEYLKSAVVYQIVLRNFTRDGNFKAATEMLEHVRSAGVDVVYLSPFVEMDCDMDETGCIPREIAYDVLLRAEGIERNEVDIFSWVHQGDTISEIIDKGGYF